MLRAALLIAFAGLALTSPARADVYKYTDEKGNVQYTDRPIALPAERLNISSQRTDVVDMANRDDTAKMAADDKARQQAQKNKVDEKKAAESNAEGKAEACNKARQEYLNRMNSQRLYEEQSDGERRYLDDKELDASRSTAKAAMDALCN